MPLAYLTFVGDDNASATSETIFTDAGITAVNEHPGVGNLSVAGTTTTVDTVTMQAANTIVSKELLLMTLKALLIIDPTAGSTIAVSGCVPVLAADKLQLLLLLRRLNVLDGIAASVSELNLLDGVTSSTAELNILDGVATAAEINFLDCRLLLLLSLIFWMASIDN